VWPRLVTGLAGAGGAVGARGGGDGVWTTGLLDAFVADEVLEEPVGARRADHGAVGERALELEARRALAARRVAGDDKRAAGRARRQLAGAAHALVARQAHAVGGVGAGSLQRRLERRTRGAWQAVDAVFGLRLVRAQLARCALAKMAVVARPARTVRDV